MKSVSSSNILRKKSTSKVLKTKTHKENDVRFLNDFLRGEKKEERELSAITPEDLDRYLAEFIRSELR